MKSQRLARIDHEIQRILGTLITQELRFCKVFVPIIGDRHQARQSLDALNSAARFLRGELGHRIDLRHTPQLIFVEDRSTERAIELAKTLREDAERHQAPEVE